MQVRRRAERIPGDLRVEMRVDVDEAGRDELAARVDLLARRGRRTLPTAVDAVAVDDDVRLERRRAAAVDDRASANDQIGFHVLTSARSDEAAP